MKTLTLLSVGLGFLAIGFSGCAGEKNKSVAGRAETQPHRDTDSLNEQKAAMAALSSEDRPLAESQGYCAVNSEPLGSMGTPVKLVLNEKAVFVCCKGCEKRAKANPEKTLAKVAELKAKVESEARN